MPTIPPISPPTNTAKIAAKNGSLLEVARVESRASLLEAKQALLTTDMQIADLTIQLNDVLGLPLNTRLVLDPNVDVSLDLPPHEESLKTALNDNPEIKEADSPSLQLSGTRRASGAALLLPLASCPILPNSNPQLGDPERMDVFEPTYVCLIPAAVIEVPITPRADGIASGSAADTSNSSLCICSTQPTTPLSR